MKQVAVTVAWGILLACGTVPAQEQQAYVSGRVLGPDGKPAANVVVRTVYRDALGLPAVLAEWIDRPVRIDTEVTSDAEGRFLVRTETDRIAGVQAVAADGSRSALMTPLAHGVRVDLELRPLRRVRGRAVLAVDGKERSAEGLALRAFGLTESCIPWEPWSRSGLDLLAQRRVGADGAFELDLPLGLPCDIEFGDGLGKLRVRASTDDDGPIEMRITARRIRTRVVDQDGAAIVGATLHVQGTGRRATSDGSGEVDVLVPDGMFVNIDAEGRAPTVLTPNDAIDPVRGIELPAAARVLSVRLADRGGALAGREFLAVTTAAGPGGTSLALLPGRSDADGRVMLRTGRPQDWIVMWVAHEGGFVRALAVQPSACETDDLGAVVLDPIVVRGTVLSPDGVPCAGVPVRFELEPLPGSPFWFGQFVAGFTDASGRFAIRGVQPRRHAFAFRNADSLPQIEVIDVAAGMEPLTIHLVRAPLIAGRVVDEDGKPVADTIVVIHDRPRILDWRHMIFSSSARTAEDGSFVLPALHPDDAHDLQVELERGGRWQSIDHPLKVRPGDSDIVVEIPRRD